MTHSGDSFARSHRPEGHFPPESSPFHPFGGFGPGQFTPIRHSRFRQPDGHPIVFTNIFEETGAIRRQHRFAPAGDGFHYSEHGRGPAHPLEEYRVKSGDNLWKIARESLKANGHDHPTGPQIMHQIRGIVDANKHHHKHLPHDPHSLSANMKLHLPHHQRPDHHHGQPHEHRYGREHAPQHGQHKHDYTYRLYESKNSADGRTSIGDGRWLSSHAARALQDARADAAAHGVHIGIISAGRTYGDQLRLYRSLAGKRPVAAPGHSNHESGNAIDVTNWAQAKPFLLRHGFIHGDGRGPINNDLAHFKFVGS
jgi:LAS superfamily LD-carboxypeptidase LdcB